MEGRYLSKLGRSVGYRFLNGWEESQQAGEDVNICRVLIPEWKNFSKLGRPVGYRFLSGREQSQQAGELCRMLIPKCWDFVIQKGRKGKMVRNDKFLWNPVGVRESNRKNLRGSFKEIRVVSQCPSGMWNSVSISIYEYNVSVKGLS